MMIGKPGLIASLNYQSPTLDDEGKQNITSGASIPKLYHLSALGSVKFN
jgi:hypothetical protein